MWALVVNPTSGQGSGRRVGAQVAQFLSNRSVPFKIIETNSAKLTSASLRSFLGSNPNSEGVIAVGGDGLVHLVIQIVAQTKVPVAFIPAGTGNDFVRALGWPLNDINEQMRSMFSTPPHYIDLGKSGSYWFAAILSTGFDSLVNERANGMKWPRGRMKYNVAMARELPFFSPREYSLVLDRKQIKTAAMLIAVGNSRSYGGGMNVCPDAQLDDGLLDVMILAPVSIPEFLKVFPKVYKGTHIYHPAVSIHRAKEVRIDADAIAYADGERMGPLPIIANSVPQALLTWRR